MAYPRPARPTSNRAPLRLSVCWLLVCGACPSRTLDVHVASNDGEPAAAQCAVAGAPPRTASVERDAGDVRATFSAVFQQVFVAAGCNAGLCHSSPNAGGLSLRTQAVAYTSLVSVSAAGQLAGDSGMVCARSGLIRVVPGNAAQSLLVQKLEQRPPCGDPMPPSSSVSPAQLRLVQTWIEGGALDD